MFLYGIDDIITDANYCYNHVTYYYLQMYLIPLMYRAFKSCKKPHPCNRCMQQRLTVYTYSYSYCITVQLYVEQGRCCLLCSRHDL